jgi:hypothetical protein
MINWEETLRRFGTNETTTKNNNLVVVECSCCHRLREVKKRTIKDQIRITGKDLCLSCKSKENRIVYKDVFDKLKPTLIEKSREGSKKRWADPMFREKMMKICSSDEHRNKVKNVSKKRWESDDYRAKMDKIFKSKDYRNKVSSAVSEVVNTEEHKLKLKKFMDTDEYRNKMKESSKEVWSRVELRDKMQKRFWDNEEYLLKVSERSKKNWQNPEYVDKMRKHYYDNPEYCKRCSEISKEMWSDSEYIKLMEDNYWNNEEWLNKQSESTKKLWEDEEYRNKMMEIFTSDEFKESMSETQLKVWIDELKKKVSEDVTNRWKDENFRNKMIESFKLPWQDEDFRIKMAKIRSLQPRISSLQTILYSVLDDLNIKYFREYEDKSADKECTIGPYSFDCVIPRDDNKTLLIECQGDYWHSRKDRISRDKSKSSYIENNLSGQYELKYLWEHEFKCKDKIVELIKYWTGINKIEIKDFDFKDVAIKKSDADEYRLLLSKYHYLPNAGKGGIAYGSYIGDELIAVCVFSPLSRQNMPYDYDKTLELSRLCIHPKYQKKNFASWFVSRSIKLLDEKYSTIVSYCDTTFNHNGAVYKSLNFRLDGTVDPDYWYCSDDGWIMHKQTLYHHAVKNGLKEKEYADMNGYKKIHGKEKLRFIYYR